MTDTILFSLFILKSLKHKNGDVWRLHPSQFYVIEVTLDLENQEKAFVDQHESVLSLLKLLPSFTCCSPKDSMTAKTGEYFMIFLCNCDSLYFR